ncbi:hypothetical protein H0H93_010830 [Arthromyces matolae]|nr:hypothetical protein H0H93_010830 [Arthromyces matolae]
MVQSHLQHYSEPTTDELPANSTLSGTVLPLGQGILTHNSAGIPIIVTCTKADLIDDDSDMAAGASGMGSMVKGKGGEWEERTDGIMQVLRTICLKYGASLFYTTTVPSTLQVLKQYALHALFIPPAPSPIASGTEPSAPNRNIFPFSHKPNTLDRDRIVVPAGWDSWGKISVMRDGFDAKSWGEAWERDLNDDHVEGVGAKRLYASLVPDMGTKLPPLPPFNNPTSEQVFLAKHYDENAKKPDRDPRGAFRNPIDLAGASAGVVGPLGSSSFNLPNVERALSEMETGIAGASSTGGLNESRRAPRNPVANSGRPAVLAPVSTAGASVGRTPASPPPTSGGPSSPTSGGQSQHEVLQNFFQSLLSSKDRASAPTNARTTAPAKPNGTGGGEDDGA